MSAEMQLKKKKDFPKPERGLRLSGKFVTNYLLCLMFKSAVCNFPQNTPVLAPCREGCLCFSKQEVDPNDSSVSAWGWHSGFWGSPRRTYVLWSVAERGRGQWGFRLASVCQQPPACDALVHTHAHSRTRPLRSFNDIVRNVSALRSFTAEADKQWKRDRQRGGCLQTTEKGLWCWGWCNLDKGPLENKVINELKWTGCNLQPSHIIVSSICHFSSAPEDPQLSFYRFVVS